MGVQSSDWAEETGTAMSDTSQVNTSGSSPTPSTYSGTGAMTIDQAENFWIQAGGNPQAAQMAAAVADASSGLNPATTRTNPDGTISVGLWLIPQNGSPPGSTDPLANARAAVQLSNNGTDWSQWCVTWSDNNCGLDGGTYLGEGNNAVGALGSNSYNVVGAAPSGDGTSASTVTNTPTTTTSSSHTILYIIIFAALVLIVFVMVRRKTGESGSGTGSEGSAWSPEETAALSGNESDTDLANRLGRSRHAIHVKRSRMQSDSGYTH